MSLPVVANIHRIRGEVYPDVVTTAGADLTGHTAHLVVSLADGTVIDTIAATVTPGASSSTITATPTALTVANASEAGEIEYAVILDMATASLRRTIATGDWLVDDAPG